MPSRYPKSIIESALAPWEQAKPMFLWVPTNPRTMLLDRVSGTHGEATAGSVPDIGGPNNNIGNSSRGLTFNTGTLFNGYSNPYIAILLVSIEDPASLTGAFLKIGGDASTGVGVGAGGSNFDTTGNNLINLLEGHSWGAGPSNAFVKGLNLVHVAATYQSDLLQAGVINTGLYFDRNNGGAWPTAGNTITIGGYSGRGTNARVQAVAIYPMTGTSAEYLAFAQARGADVQHLLGTPYADATALFRETARRNWAVGTVSGSFSATGSITSSGSVVTGTATKTQVYSSTGAVVGSGATVAGTATRSFDSTGTVAGSSSIVTGTATNTQPSITSTGAVTGQGAVVSGTATRQFTSTGAVSGPGATVTGAATKTQVYSSTGDVVGGGAVVAGTATNTPLGISAYGDVAGQGSIVSGVATRTFSSTGAVIGQGATVAGTATRTFTATGAIAGYTAVITGAATNTPLGINGYGGVSGQGASVSGTATVTAVFAATGAVVGSGATINGYATNVRVVTSSGVISGQGATVAGAATVSGITVWPLASDVRRGVSYGPTGNDYTGTLSVGTGSGGGMNVTLSEPRLSVVSRDNSVYVFLSRVVKL